MVRAGYSNAVIVREGERRGRRLLKIDMMNLDQDFLCRGGEVSETNAIQGIVEQEHLISATARDEGRGGEGGILGDFSHSHGELFVGHGVDPVDCVVNCFRFGILVMLLILLLDVLGETLGWNQQRGGERVKRLYLGG
jgi:hypothetical protein